MLWVLPDMNYCSVLVHAYDTLWDHAGELDVRQCEHAVQARAVELSALGPKALSFTSQTSSQQAAEERGDAPSRFSFPCPYEQRQGKGKHLATA